MAEKVINTRIQLKYDTWENWNSAAGQAYVLKAGEMGICAVPVAAPNGKTDRVLFKIGDDKTTFAKLDWASAVAADVYDWAKAATKPTYTAEEVGLGNVLNVESYSKTETYSQSEIDTKISELQSSLEADTDTQYKLVLEDHTLKLQSKAKDSETWTTAQSFSIVDSVVTGTTNGTVAVNGTDVAVKGLGDAAYKSTSYFDNKIGSAQTAAEGAQSSADTAKAAADAAQATADNALPAATFESFKTTNTAAIAEAKKAGTDAASALADEVTARASGDKTNSDAIDAVKGRVETLESTITGLTGAMHFVGESTTDPKTGVTIEGHTTFAAGDVCFYGQQEYVYTGSKWIEFGDEGSHATTDYVDSKISDAKAEIKVTTDAISGRVDKLETDVGTLNSKVTENAAAITKKVDAVAGKGLSTNDYTTADKTKLAGVAEKATHVEESTVSGWGFTKNTGTVNKITINGAVKTITDGAVDLGTYLTAHQDISGKQDKLTADQLAAANSGITAAKVSTYDGYASKISTLEGKAGLDKVGTVTTVTAGEGLKITGTASVSPKIEIDDSITFVFNCGGVDD